MNISGLRPGNRARKLGAAAAVVAALVLGGCDDVSVSVAEVDSVEVTPNPVTLIEGESVTAEATPRARGGTVLRGRTTTWSSDDPDIVSISDEGVLEGRQAGATRIRAEIDGVEGTADVEVGEAPRIALGENSVVGAASAGQSQDVTLEVSIENVGGGELSGLEAGVEMEDSPEADWLSATLTDSAAPTTLTITLSARDLEPGNHRGSVPVRSPAAVNSPQTVRVRMEVGEREDDDGPEDEDEPEDDDEPGDDDEPEDDEPEDDDEPEEDQVAQERLQVASGLGAVATATLDATPTPGNLLVAVLWHRHDWQTPVLTSERQWERVALHVEDAGAVGDQYRKGIAVWVRHAGENEPATLSGSWEELDPNGDRETVLMVLELSGYGDFLGAAEVQSSGASSTDQLSFGLTAPGAVVGIVGSRDGPETTSTWADMHSPHRIHHTETSGLSSVVQSALGRVDDVPWEASVALGEEVPALAVLLRFALP